MYYVALEAFLLISQRASSMGDGVIVHPHPNSEAAREKFRLIYLAPEMDLDVSSPQKQNLQLQVSYLSKSVLLLQCKPNCQSRDAHKAQICRCAHPCSEGAFIVNISHAGVSPLREYTASQKAT